ncbi:DUF2264 domain-containing protein [Martelella sp. HB161492]|uniref:DUF2264 domain-containing protein n=1 Tax=Martelella sp. HB161492 TaxID=2720726 RepID=UPI0015905D65|nr:DUF2264 domain-containing protein [Martelella sp. HB161492]
MSREREFAWDRLPIIQKMAANNPMNGNPLKIRDDMAVAVSRLFAPLKDHFSTGNARIELSAGAAHYDDGATAMEAFVRPLWGMAPLVAGGYAFDEAWRYVEGLANGMDPEHPEYWGDIAPFDQRLVEMAGIALALLVAPKIFWEPMPDAAKKKAVSYLLKINTYDVADNNWLFFRVLTNLALRNVGEEWSEAAVRAALERIESFYIADGYYLDGKWRQRDYYSPMALHFYGLVVAKVAGDLFPDYAARYRERARLFAQDFQHWFADDGAAIPYGRSLTYRFAEGAFWAGCAFADEEVLPWGRIKGLLLRHLRWWSDRPITDRDGILNIGYAYPNLFMSESYNAPGSPYWALKSFLVLCLEKDHPFWAAEEEAPEALPGGRVIAPAAGFIVRRAEGDTVMLTGGQDGHEHRGFDAKYSRFAYSSAFAFSVKCDMVSPEQPDKSAVDCGMMISRDGRTFISRAEVLEEGIDQNMAFGRWRPDERITIESWLDFASEGWHVRIHRIVTEDALVIAESGFSLDRTGENAPGFAEGLKTEPGLAMIRTGFATSAIRDLTGDRMATNVRAAPNTNLRFPRTLFPRIEGRVGPGETYLVSAAFGVTRPMEALPPIAVPETVASFCAARGIVLNAF